MPLLSATHAARWRSLTESMHRVENPRYGSIRADGPDGPPPGCWPGMERVYLSFTIMAFQVSGPTMPSGRSPKRRWKALAAACVFGPKMPSTAMMYPYE